MMYESETVEWEPRKRKGGKRTKYDTTNRPQNPYRREHREKMGTWDFVAWDGEGHTVGNDHHYMLFGNSLGESVKAESLTWRECFPLLLQGTKDNAINVIYSGDYDIIMMTKGMPKDKLNRLLTGRPVKYGGYRMEYYRRKWFSLRHIKSGRHTRLYDVFSFFSQSFVKACVEYLGDDDTLREIDRMKRIRNSFTFDDPEVEPYWKAELEYLVKLMERLRFLLAEVGIKPQSWHGPGAVANAVLKREGIRKRYCDIPIPAEVVDVAEHAYYGGRFEQFKVGRLKNVYEYDIRSAYPFAATRLPDFTHCTWEHQFNPTGQLNDYALYKVSWEMPTRPMTIAPFPWRQDNGEIFFPYKGFESWYWGIEIGQSYKVAKVTFHEAWIPTFDDPLDRPFSFIKAMYENRAQMKREGNPAQMALKLAMNSIYGKLAQSVGAKLEKGVWKKPIYHNILWAGWITAFTRGKLMHAVRKNRASIVAFETDALFTTKPIDFLPIGEELGQWECVKLPEILYIHSGVYYAMKEDGLWRLKSRGIETDKNKSVEEWQELFAKLPHERHEISITVVRFGTDLRQPEYYGRWYEMTKSTKMPSVHSKRVHVNWGCFTCHLKPEYSYLAHSHDLIVPQGAIESDWISSSPYAFPWRDDVKFEWSEVIKSEVLKEIEGFQWH